MTMQQRAPDPTGTNVRGVWVNPMRDVAHNFPYVVKQALEAMETDKAYNNLDEVSKQQMAQYGKTLGEFVNGCVGPNSPDTVAELMERVGLLTFPPWVVGLFGKWLARAMFGLYFTSIREALHPGEKPLGVTELMAKLEDTCE